jgi:1,4-dihydroxy-2-naphthoate octaprenyltransferase
MIPFACGVYLIFHNESVCHHKAGSRVSSALVAGFAAFVSDWYIQSQIKSLITDKHWRRFIKSTAGILWAYTCGFLYTGLFSWVCDRDLHEDGEAGRMSSRRLAE